MKCRKGDGGEEDGVKNSGGGGGGGGSGGGRGRGERGRGEGGRGGGGRLKKRKPRWSCHLTNSAKKVVRKERRKPFSKSSRSASAGSRG
ncbi:hypothetical protein EJ06DRAFT_91400 [Trichodelitschia bisporula]|uniref:Uncharacterized protein n=1 Tax=Trichodelitschia bisporula TaxID=703511 RepID=A0A6G1HSG8_9PEZI|nr:hypothetical protein EJ06DRAFT_91400 [Trichodelitschia bisporula]